MWPISAAAPKPPRSTIRRWTMPPPTPVPTVTNSRSSVSSPAPKRYSPQAAALASFSTTTGRSTSLPTASASGSSSQSMLGANITVARSTSMKPAAPMPMPPTSTSGPLEHRSTSVATTAAMPVASSGVGSLSATHDAAVGRHETRGDLGATDVDTDAVRVLVGQCWLERAHASSVGGGSSVRSSTSRSVRPNSTAASVTCSTTSGWSWT